MGFSLSIESRVPLKKIFGVFAALAVFAMAVPGVASAATGEASASATATATATATTTATPSPTAPESTPPATAGPSPSCDTTCQTQCHTAGTCNLIIVIVGQPCQTVGAPARTANGHRCACQEATAGAGRRWGLAADGAGEKPDDLPVTGTATAAIGVLGAVILLVGVGGLVVSRRRQRVKFTA